MSGLSQDPLWEEPSWVTYYPPGTRVRSRWTGNEGTVTAADDLARHIWVAWEGSFYRDAEACRHHSESGLERL